MSENDFSAKEQEAGEKESNVTELLKNIWKQIRALFAPPLLKYIILSCSICFLNMFG